MGGFSGAHFRDLKTTAEIAERYRFPTPAAARQFIRRYGIPRFRRGRIVLVDVRDFEAACAKLLRRPGFVPRKLRLEHAQADFEESQAVAMRVVR